LDSFRNSGMLRASDRAHGDNKAGPIGSNLQNETQSLMKGRRRLLHRRSRKIIRDQGYELRVSPVPESQEMVLEHPEDRASEGRDRKGHRW
jgi:hypothetical protein